MKHNLKGPIILAICAFIWGTAFSAQSNAADHIQPYTFVFLRCAITAMVLFGLMPLLKKLRMESDAEAVSLKRHVSVGILLGIILVAATSLQQMGLQYTTTAKSGFITALYIVIVPILGIFAGRRPSPLVWLGVGVALIGLYLLCSDGALNFNSGDLLTFGCAFVFSLHIICIDHFGGRLHSILLSAIQFATAAVLAGILMLLTETPKLTDILACWPSILYVAIFSGAIGYTFQIIGQKHTNPTLASLIMCLESVFAALGGWVLLHEVLTLQEMAGCALMLGASVIALLPSRSTAK